MATLNNTVSSNPPYPGEDRVAPVPEAYLLADLGVLADQSPLLPVALNDRGELAAQAEAPASERESWKMQGFLLRQGRLTHAGIPPGRTPLGGLSSTGLLCGAARRGGSPQHAWASHLGWFGEMLWPDCDSFCTGINGEGAVTGHVHATGEDGAVGKRAFLLTGAGRFRLLVPPWAEQTGAAAINDAGTVLLNTTNCEASDRGTRTWLWSDGRFRLLENIGGGTWGVALTPAGHVAGHGLTALGELHALFWREGRVHDLNPGADWESEALGAHDQGTVVGRLIDPRGQSQAFRWTPAEGLRPLAELTAYAEDWTLLKATGVNAAGQIAGIGLLGGRRRGFLLTPAA